MKIQDMRQMTLTDLQVKLRELTEEQFNLKFRLATQPLDDPLRLRKVRRDIARVRTLIREMQRAAASGDEQTG
jgi:large subunit ribosomal protein L29